MTFNIVHATTEYVAWEPAPGALVHSPYSAVIAALSDLDAERYPTHPYRHLSHGQLTELARTIEARRQEAYDIRLEKRLDRAREWDQ